MTQEPVQLERRGAERTDLARPCKLFDPRTGKYATGLTWNISTTGVMLESTRPLDLSPGDRVFLGVAMKRRQALLLNQQMIPCEVVRALTSTTRYSAIAVKFIDSASLAEPETVELKPQRRAA